MCGLHNRQICGQTNLPAFMYSSNNTSPSVHSFCTKSIITKTPVCVSSPGAVLNLLYLLCKVANNFNISLEKVSQLKPETLKWSHAESSLRRAQSLVITTGRLEERGGLNKLQWTNRNWNGTKCQHEQETEEVVPGSEHWAEFWNAESLTR